MKLDQYSQALVSQSETHWRSVSLKVTERLVLTWGVCEVSSRGRHLDATCNLSSLHAERGNLKEAMELYDVASRSSGNKAWFSYEFRFTLAPARK